MEYYKKNNWEEEYIIAAKETITNIWNKNYKDKILNIIQQQKRNNDNIDSNNNNNDDTAIEEEEDDDDDIFSHIFKKRKVESKKDELDCYLKEEIENQNINILIWWKVLLFYYIKFIFYIKLKLFKFY